MSVPHDNAGGSDRPSGRRQRAPRTRKPPSRRDEIIEVAAGLFAKDGFDATTVADIANELGILSGSLYHYINAKEDLLYWIVQKANANLSESLSRLDVDALPPDDALCLVIANHITVALNNLNIGSVSRREIDRLPDAQRHEIVTIRQGYEDIVCGIIQRGQSDGTFRVDVHPRLSAIACLTLANTLYTWFRPGRAWTIETVATTYSKVLTDGLRAGHEPIERTNSA